MFFLQMSGFPGSGKSTLAKKIARNTKAIIVDHDIVKSAMLTSLEKYQENIKQTGPVSYHIDWALIDFYLSQGHSVIFDAPCLYDVMIENGVFLSTKYGASYKYVEVYLNDCVEINQRLQKRDRMVSQIESVLSEEGFQQALNESKKPINVPYITVNSSKPVDTYLPEVLTYIRGDSE